MCQFYLLEGLSNEMVQSRKMSWNMGENVIQECERTIENGKNWNFRYQGIAEIERGVWQSEALDIYVGCIVHPFAYTLVSKMTTLVFNCILVDWVWMKTWKTFRSKECNSRMLKIIFSTIAINNGFGVTDPKGECVNWRFLYTKIPQITLSHFLLLGLFTSYLLSIEMLQNIIFINCNVKEYNLQHSTIAFLRSRGLSSFQLHSIQ